MFEKNILTLILSMILLGTAITAFPIPVVWGMGCLIFLAFAVSLRIQHQE